MHLPAVAVMGDQKGSLTDLVTGAQASGFLKTVWGFQGGLFADAYHLVVKVFCQDQGFSPAVDMDHIRPGKHPGGSSQKIIIQIAEGSLQSLGGEIVKCLRNGSAVAVRGNGDIYMDMLVVEDKVIEGRGQPDLEVSESPGSQLFAQPDDGSLGNIAFSLNSSRVRFITIRGLLSMKSVICFSESVNFFFPNNCSRIMGKPPDNGCTSLKKSIPESVLFLQLYLQKPDKKQEHL